MMLAFAQVGSIADGCSDTGPHFDPTNVSLRRSFEFASFTSNLLNIFCVLCTLFKKNIIVDFFGSKPLGKK